MISCCCKKNMIVKTYLTIQDWWFLKNEWKYHSFLKKDNTSKYVYTQSYSYIKVLFDELIKV